LATPGSAAISSSTGDGAIDGVAPISGTFSIGFKGENTTQIPVTATAADVKAALEDLYSIGSVTVTRDGYGAPFAYDQSYSSALIG